MVSNSRDALGRFVGRTEKSWKDEMFCGVIHCTNCSGQPRFSYAPVNERRPHQRLSGDGDGDIGRHVPAPAYSSTAVMFADASFSSRVRCSSFLMRCTRFKFTGSPLGVFAAHPCRYGHADLMMVLYAAD